MVNTYTHLTLVSYTRWMLHRNNLDNSLTVIVYKFSKSANVPLHNISTTVLVLYLKKKTFIPFIQDER